MSSFKGCRKEGLGACLGPGGIMADSQVSQAEVTQGRSRFKMSSEEHEKWPFSVAFLFPFHLVWTREATRVQ